MNWLTPIEERAASVVVDNTRGEDIIWTLGTINYETVRLVCDGTKWRLVIIENGLQKLRKINEELKDGRSKVRPKN